MTANGNDKYIDIPLTETVQKPPSVTRDGIMTQWSQPAVRSSYLPAYGTRARDLALRDLYRMDEMVLIRGGVAGISKNIAALPWTISKVEQEDINPAYEQIAQAQGWYLKRSTGVEYFQEVFRQSNFGGGWADLLTMTVADFLRYDCGAFIEVIGAGDSYEPLVGNIVGLAHLDPLRCYPTGDPRYPAVYYDRWGGLHVLHHTRVIRIVDMPDGDEYRPGYGDSALARAVSVALRQMWTTRYINGRVDDKAPPGLTVIGGIMRAEWEAQTAKYTQQQMNDALPTYGQRQFYHTPDPSIMPKIESYEFQDAPEKFDFRIYTDIDVDMFALALGVDRQELMQLSGGGALGSGEQSVILAQKSRGKTIGYLLQQVERRLNDLLPVDYTFEFKFRDSQEALEEANKANQWGAFVATIGADLTQQQRLVLLSNQVEAVKDALDQAPTANDVDVQPELPVIGEDNTAGTGAAQPDVRVNVDDEVQAKAYVVTESAFVQDVRDLLRSAIQPDNPYLDKRGFGVTMRSLLKRYGEQAYKDGMAQGGVYVDALDPEDYNDYMAVFMEQSQYISGFANDTYSDKISGGNLDTRAYMWGKSLQSFLDRGTMAANQNAMYAWKRSPVSDSCADCIRLDGQVHRIRNWTKSGWLPRGNKILCKGYNCSCQLVRTSDKARGRF